MRLHGPGMRYAALEFPKPVTGFVYAGPGCRNPAGEFVDTAPELRNPPVPHTVIRVKVKPGSRVSALEEAGDGTWVARLKSPPVDGKANAELIALVARRFGCSKAAVSIQSGAAARTKLVRIEGD